MFHLIPSLQQMSGSYFIFKTQRTNTEMYESHQYSQPFQNEKMDCLGYTHCNLMDEACQGLHGKTHKKDHRQKCTLLITDAFLGGGGRVRVLQLLILYIFTLVPKESHTKLFLFGASLFMLQPKEHTLSFRT